MTTVTVTILDLEFDVIVHSFVLMDPGRFSGPPEDCYPAEGGEVEWSVNNTHPIAEFIQSAVDNNDDWKESVEEQILEELNEEPEPPEPEPDY